MMTLGNFSCGLLCAGIGLPLLLSKGKAANLIAGYNTMDTAKKNQIDPVKLSRYTGRMLLYAGGEMIFFGIIYLFYPAFWLLLAGWIAFAVIIVIGVIRANIGNPFEKG